MKKILYWFIQVTWGLPATLLGFFVFIFVLIFKRPRWFHRNGYSFIVEFGDDWGGLSLGPFAFCGSYVAGFDLTQFDYDKNVFNKYYKLFDEEFFEHVRRHEYGHSIQNLMWGPLWLFVVGIPSVIRYNDRLNKQIRNIPIKTEYDDIWFEGQATKLGKRYVDKHEDDKVTD